MKNILHALVASIAIATLVPAEALANPQHERMKRCNAEAKEQALKGDERKAFMSTCLKGKHEGTAAQAAVPSAPVVAAVAGSASPAPVAAVAQPASPPASQPISQSATAPVAAAPVAVAPVVSADKKKACNQAATEQALSGAKRKAFIAECAKG